MQGGPMKKFLLMTFCMLAVSANAATEATNRTIQFLTLPPNAIQPDNSFKISRSYSKSSTTDQARLNGKLLCSEKEFQNKINAIANHIGSIQDLLKKDEQSLSSWDKEKALRQLRE